MIGKFLNAKVKNLLIRELRLGSRCQTRDFLKRGNKCCVLGLICELFHLETGIGSWEGPYQGKQGVTDAYCFLVDNEWSIELPSARILSWAGMTTEFAKKLYQLNDIERQTFAGIANYIEAA